MRLLVPFILVLCIAWCIAFFSSSRVMRGLARTLVLVIATGLLLAAVFCLVYPVFNREAGILIIPAIVLGIGSWLLFPIWTMLRTRETYLALSHADKAEADREQIMETVEELERQIGEDRAKVGRFFITPTRRKQLRGRIAQNEFMLQGLRVMKGGHDEYVEKQIPRS